MLAARDDEPRIIAGHGPAAGVVRVRSDLRAARQADLAGVTVTVEDGRPDLAPGPRGSAFPRTTHKAFRAGESACLPGVAPLS